MDIIQAVESKVLQLSATILESINGGCSYFEVQKRLKSDLNHLGVSLMKEILEGLDEKIREERGERRGYHVVHRNQKNRIVTLFGEMEYRRTYYREKATGKYVYLADERVGITPHMRVDPVVKAELMEDAASISYEQATCQFEKQSGVKLSKQTVAKTVESFPPHKPEEPESKKKVKTLYIECDEDHIPCKRKPGLQARLIYVHEGRVGTKKRPALKNAYYFTSVTKDVTDFWFEVCDYLASHYDLFYLEKIFLSGDGASWIRTGTEVMPDNVFFLDRYHLSKYILGATGHVKGMRSKVYNHIKELDLPGAVEHLREAADLAKTESRRKRVEHTIRYITNNWNGIKTAVTNPDVSCSAEGHVSHVLSDRMSSRPKSWSIEGAEKMASMRAMQASKESIEDIYLKACPEGQPLLVLKEEAEKQMKKLRKRIYGNECRGNMPLLQGGFSFTREAIKSLIDKKVC
ncbi:MAG: ISLre2 family transposase [Firmicutes bacterium]|jgi:hypothetical protein|nr:ISLre2 family transposase [Bacillota bacterium]